MENDPLFPGLFNLGILCRHTVLRGGVVWFQTDKIDFFDTQYNGDYTNITIRIDPQIEDYVIIPDRSFFLAYDENTTINITLYTEEYFIRKTGNIEFLIDGLVRETVYVDLTISEEANLVTVITKVTCTITDMKALIYLVIRDPLYKATYDLLIDKREVKYTPIVCEVLEVSQFLAPLKQHFEGKIAIVIDSELFYSMFKLSSQYTSKNGFNSNIFHDPDEALSWITNTDTL